MTTKRVATARVVAGYFSPMPPFPPAPAFLRRVIGRQGLCGPWNGWAWMALLVWAATAEVAHAGPPPAAGSPPLTAPLPGVVAYAAQHALPLAGIERDTTRASAVPGDEVIALITLFKAGAVEQWLGRFRVAEPDAGERGAKEAEIVLYSTTGAKHVFTSAVAVIEMQLAGPFHEGAAATAEAGGTVAERHARLRVRSDFLALGLEQWYADVLLRNEVPNPRFLPNDYGTAPFSAKQIAETAAIAREVGFTPEADRGAAGGGLALGEFFSLAQQTPGLREIVAEVVDRPSVWSFLKVSQVGVGFYWADRVKVVSRFDAAAWGWTGVTVYRGASLLVLNRKLAANVAFFVTAPQPPLVTSAGIVAFTVESPSRPDHRVELRVLAARSGRREGEGGVRK